ncbi:MAG: hypothetical protein IKE58_13045 [Blautia sp.]|nr:hypothetical protein [Blautia sp.]
MKKLLLLLVFWLGWLTVSVGYVEAEENVLPKWTVMFYMCGSDLESRYGYASTNLMEIANSHDIATLYQEQAKKLGMDNGVPSRDVNVVLQTGGCSAWHNDEISEKTTDKQIRTDVLQRWHYDPYEETSTSQIRLKEELPLSSMSDPETLSDFIRWSAQEYPAEKYMLVLWDHGGGSRTGIFVDELFGGDILYLYELGQALKDSGILMEAVLFDACLMANLETACMIKDYANWMIASEEVVTGEGTAIGQWLMELCSRPEMDGRKLGRIICDTAQEKCAMLGDIQGGQLLTWSVIDLGKVGQTAECMEELFAATAAIYTQFPELVSFYMKQKNLAEKYGNAEDKMTDLYNIIILSPALHEKGIDLRNRALESLEDAVVYCVRGSGRVMARGLSFCFATDMTNEELDIYAKNCPSPHYLAVLDAITPWTAPDSLYDQVERLPDIDDMEAYDIVVEHRVGPDGTPVIALAGSDINVNRINCNYYRLDEETGNVILLGYVPTKELPTQDGQAQFTIDEPWKWPCVGDEFCCISLIEYVYGECLYEIPVQVDMNIWRFRCGYAKEKGYEIYGVWEGYNSSSNMFNRNVVSLASMAGQTYRLLYPILNTRTGLQGGDYEYSESQTITRVLPVESKPLPPGTYYIEYVVEDMFMRRIPMERVAVHWDGSILTLAEDAVWEGTETLRWK